MKISYTLTRTDLFLYQVSFALMRRPSLWFFILGAFIVLLPIGTHLANGGENLLATCMVSATLFIYFFLGYIGILILSILVSFVSAFTGNKLGVIGEHTLEIKKEGLEETSDSSVVFHKWENLRKTWKKWNFVGIHITDTCAWIIPTRRVKEGTLVFDFEQEVKKQIESNKTLM